MSQAHRKDRPIEVRADAHQPLGMPATRFLRDYWQKRPLLIRNAFPDFAPPLSPDDLAGLACEDLALSRIVLRDARRDRWTLRTGPFAESGFSKLPNDHWTLLVQDVDKWDADVAALLDRFAFLPSWRIDDVMVSYATDGGGVGAHLDQYDVFLLQGIGRRRWRISIDARAPHDFRTDTELKLLKHFEPTHEWTLDPGDMLYLPPGVPHEGAAIGECMTFSIGMRAPASSELLVEFAEQVAAGLPESQRYADPDLQPAAEPGELDRAALQRARAALGACAQAMDEEAFADFFGRFITAYRSAQNVAPPKRPPGAQALDAKLEASAFVRNPWSRFAGRRAGRGAVRYVGGESHASPQAWARALAGGGRSLAGAELARLPQRAAGVALLASLIQAGHVAVRRR
jgi:50S ribosomal protein L16 3-hydroxylase